MPKILVHAVMKPTIEQLEFWHDGRSWLQKLFTSPQSKDAQIESLQISGPFKAQPCILAFSSEETCSFLQNDGVMYWVNKKDYVLEYEHTRYLYQSVWTEPKFEVSEHFFKDLQQGEKAFICHLDFVTKIET